MSERSPQREAKAPESVLRSGHRKRPCPDSAPSPQGRSGDGGRGFRRGGRRLGRGGGGGRHNYRRTQNPRRPPSEPHAPSQVGLSQTNRRLVEGCSVCRASQPKYKCPKCRAPYCSVACCRAHKDGACCSPSTPKDEPPSVEGQNSGELSPIGRSRYQLECEQIGRVMGPFPSPSAHSFTSAAAAPENWDEGWSVSPEMLRTMHESDWLRRELRDGGLQELVLRVTRASNFVGRHGRETEQERVLEQLRSNLPTFRLFLDKLLVITGILERQQGDASDDLNEWLSRDAGSSDSQGLFLKPIAGRATVDPTTISPAIDQDASSVELSTSSSDSSDASSNDCSDIEESM